ncbi:RcnB family protein [Paracoccus saliphilus]|uniref:RcnB family protein n=1 Tax=Paracoccus saliphilus TaxID=405559 RepID=A0AA45W8S4_9RHOB|nr:RcnB family protein [Paracoccus saliphilus]WCR02647.1 RcnB family protein [Paracoccus saliphilus]SIT18509.1 regulator RcnB of Ni and Co efflux [Paracoccus saliphilus]
MKRLILAATASLVALSGAAQADNPRKDNHHRGNAVHAAPGQVKKQEVRRDTPKPDARRSAPRQIKKQEVRRDAPKSSARRFAPGQRMPKGYQAIVDYRHYGLPHPGRGYRYVHYNNDVYKVSTETNTVAALIGALAALR